MKLKKVIVILMLLLMSILVLPKNAYAASVKMSNIPQLKAFIEKGHNGGTLGPIQIVPGTLVKEWTGSLPVYLIALSGTEFEAKEQSTDIWTDIKSGFELDSPYLEAVVKAIVNNIPKNSNLIISGHSLGGMIAQQLSGNSKIKDNYNVENVITLGSPLINPFGREGEVQRLGDTSDLVPYLSATGNILLPWQVSGLNRENGGYRNPVEAHTKSYSRYDLWGDYDILGFEDGKSYLEYDERNVKFYKAPIKQ